MSNAGSWKAERSSIPNVNAVIIDDEHREIARIVAGVSAGYSKSFYHATLFAAAPEMLEALEAVQRYDAAIYQRAKDGDYELNAIGAIAQGVDLDALYMDMKTKTDAAVSKVKGGA